MQQINANIKKALYDKLLEREKESGVSQSKIIEAALMQYLTQAPITQAADDKGELYASQFVKNTGQSIRSFALKNGLEYITFFKSITGVTKPTYEMMFRLRNVIPPSWWVTTTAEAKPEPKRFTGPDDYRIVREHSAGYKHLEPLTYSWCAENGVDYNRLYNLKSRKAFGFPSYSMIRALRHWIDPDLWFIYEKRKK
ncbi:ribbon-helix-helix protein, CopG family [Treponema sp. OMZ 305]|uniref:ribbon-helix-helix protein, CopG family n=1 Tax=Treponema TaxID=157 RepID=UPI001BAFEB67|nr:MULTISPECIES: ribbon-helix-helix protein, CopG family [Treponema]QUY17666.1 ribbon-helix-helix protein, CopG family [Treponema vincentii]UTC57550.1 ribbon-helix-helix protein, CopG family [Treponema sp. OMZ 305]